MSYGNDVDHANIISKSDVTDFLEWYDDRHELADDESESAELREDARSDLDEYDHVRIRELRYMADSDDDSFVSDDYWEEYAEDFANEIYNIPEGIGYYVDYEKYASDLQMDYTTYPYDGKTYYAKG